VPFGRRLDEFAFPSSHHHCRKTVPNQVYARPRHVHQLVDAEDDGDTFQRQPELNQGTGENHE
jgi:hypothetical protein